MQPTILLVDDLQMFLEIERDFFKHTDVNIVTARDGLEALEVVKSEKPSLVFMDLQMPNMDGAACCRAIRSHPDHADVPVVIISSTSVQQDKDDCLAAGCNYFLTKPAGRDRFLEIAREFIPGIDRRERRRPCSLSGTLQLNGEASSCTLYDLGVDGTYVVTDLPAKSGNVVTLSFTLPDGTLVDSPCKVIWSGEKTALRPKGLGLKFALLPKPIRSALARSLERL
ncbi:response regulator [Geomonas nitrogeniifigens]|uniref:Response regulator n=1 Tax=Geomonas diazotrophica TaxID=2843197 RepID=A0ABX8JGU8_9BACT|nr:response regulator [Geomonas nitrogeniifigens]QWV97615.1 response regulator [Geomonas nitrogeniifigens]